MTNQLLLLLGQHQRSGTSTEGQAKKLKGTGQGDFTGKHRDQNPHCFCYFFAVKMPVGSTLQRHGSQAFKRWDTGRIYALDACNVRQSEKMSLGRTSNSIILQSHVSLLGLSDKHQSISLILWTS